MVTETFWTAILPPSLSGIPTLSPDGVNMPDASIKKANNKSTRLASAKPLNPDLILFFVSSIILMKYKSDYLGSCSKSKKSTAVYSILWLNFWTIETKKLYAR